MSKKYRYLINVAIFILIIILVYVMMSYYAKGSSVIPTNQDRTSLLEEQNPVKDETPKAIITPVITRIQKVEEASGDKIEVEDENTIASEENKQDILEEKTENSKDDLQENELQEVQQPQAVSPVIMTSENEISSKEKREILSELDQTLMELLEVVDKVQPVDESRLPSDSEVEEP